MLVRHARVQRNRRLQSAYCVMMIKGASRREGGACMTEKPILAIEGLGSRDLHD